MIHRRSFFAMMLGAAALPAVAAPPPARDLDWASIAKLQGVPERWTMPEMRYRKLVAD